MREACCSPGREGWPRPGSPCRSAPRSTATPASRAIWRSRRSSWRRSPHAASPGRASTSATSPCSARSAGTAGWLPSSSRSCMKCSRRRICPRCAPSASARRTLPRYSEIVAALRSLKVLTRNGAIPVSVDLADLRGYHYHSGVVFAAYAPGVASAVALGGRYDEVGKAFGRARPATGFSMDLRDLARTAPHEAEAAAIRAPFSNDAGLATAIRELRTAGEVVVVGLPGRAAEGAQPDCDRALVKRAGKWTVRN